MTTSSSPSAPSSPSSAPAPTTRDQRRVLSATLIGTTVEWYDFFIYANAAAIIFAAQYFGPLEEQSPGLAQLISYASVGISFVFRPLGAVLAGWLGDRFGRRIVLVLTLSLMGLATFLIGVLPTYASIGIWAPVLLILLRILQGTSAGGEWGGAALMAVEHAPTSKRGLFGAYPQIGVPLGMLLASAILALLALVLDDDQFSEWGWRLPFVLSLVLIVIGYYIRRRVAESPVFQAMNTASGHDPTPLKDLFRHDAPTVIKAALIFIGNNSAGYMVSGGFILGYATTTLGMDRDQLLVVISVASAAWVATTMLGGRLSDRIGRRPTYLIGYGLMIVWVIPMFLLIDTGSIWVVLAVILVLTVGVGLTYGPQSATYAEMFPAAIRFSGVSISYAIGAVLGGAFAPTIAQLLTTSTGWIGAVGIYLVLTSLISAGAVLSIREPRGRRLAPDVVDDDGEQAVGAATPTEDERGTS